jgi:hypothetical protein
VVGAMLVVGAIHGVGRCAAVEEQHVLIAPTLRPADRQAYGFRNPLNQRRRVCIARTRGYRRRPRTAT